MLKQYFDAAVMLTWSDWNSEPRSNRYHYAIRFAEHLPVFFVQPDLAQESYLYEETKIKNVTILHLYKYYGKRQTDLFTFALKKKGIIRPLLWIYNYFFLDIIQNHFSPLRVFHATEDYFCKDFFADLSGNISQLVSALRHSDLLISVSSGVQDSFHQKGGYRGSSLILTNGCDYHFWAEGVSELPSSQLNNKTAIFQGGVNNRVDFQLFSEIAAKLPDWDFEICGRESLEPGQSFDQWKALLKRTNVKYLGELSLQDLKKHLYGATVGLIPFIQNEYIIEKSLPLKAFEYVACGLPVVTVPIKALLLFPKLFSFAGSAQEFATAITHDGASRFDSEAIRIRCEEAKKHDYDHNFQILSSQIHSEMDRQRKRSDTPLNLLILYDRRSLHVPTIREHLESFARYSRNKIYYVCATFGVTDHEPAICQVDMSIFDAVIIHYSVRLSLTNHLSESFANHLRHYGGFKILFIQDEYDNVNTACDWIKDLGIHLVFSCVPLNFLDRVYPKDKFPLVEFIPTLTGYVPYKAEHFGNLKPHGDRKYLIGYRGRALPYWYGRLGQEKFLIGKTMKDICAARNLCVSIEWDDAKRIYGDAWYQFLGDSKATLGTESGSNVFDFDGDISRAIQEALRINPQLTFNEAYDNFLKSHEGKITMNQISPRIFEAIAMRTGLVLFEGNYSGIIKAGEHFIPLKKDFSNVDEVLSYVQDSRYLEALTNRAYQDIIQSEKYTYNQFIHDFDQIVSTRYRGRKEINCLAMVFGFQIEGQREIYSLGKSNVFSGPVESGSFLPVGSPSKSFSFHKVSTLLLYMWHYLPLRVRQKLKPKIQSIFAKALKRL